MCSHLCVCYNLRIYEKWPETSKNFRLLLAVVGWSRFFSAIVVFVVAFSPNRVCPSKWRTWKLLHTKPKIRFLVNCRFVYVGEWFRLFSLSRHLSWWKTYFIPKSSVILNQLLYIIIRVFLVVWKNFYLSMSHFKQTKIYKSSNDRNAMTTIPTSNIVSDCAGGLRLFYP